MKTLLDVDTINRAYDHEPHGRVTDADGSSHAACPGWLGFGYLGERRNVIDAIHDGQWSRGLAGLADISASDEAVLDYANSVGWSEHQLFEWLNSRDGRHFADQSLTGVAGLRQALTWRLLPGALGAAWSR